MAVWAATRRAAELCAMGAARQAAPFACIPGRRGLQFIPPQLKSSARRFTFSTVCSLAAPSEKSFGFPRPDEILWRKDLTNKVLLIGHLNETVSIKYLDHGGIVASTSIRVQRDPSSSYSDFYLQFWDELAEVAAAHLKKGDCVHVSGSLWVENFMKDSQQMSICKVVCRDLKFVSNLSEPSTVRDNTKAKRELEDVSAVEKLWELYFQNPTDFWDNRSSKKTSRSPDFVHKNSRAAMWLSNVNTPSWVYEKLTQDPIMPAQKEDPIMPAQKAEKVKEIEHLWQEFFADPLDWWDNRNNKKKPTYPDFKSKSTGDALWIENNLTPTWVKSQLQILDSKTASSRDGNAGRAGGSGKTSMSSTEDEYLMFF